MSRAGSKTFLSSRQRIWSMESIPHNVFVFCFKLHQLPSWPQLRVLSSSQMTRRFPTPIWPSSCESSVFCSVPGNCLMLSHITGVDEAPLRVISWRFSLNVLPASAQRILGNFQPTSCSLSFVLSPSFTLMSGPSRSRAVHSSLFFSSLLLFADGSSFPLRLSWACRVSSNQTETLLPFVSSNSDMYLMSGFCLLNSLFSTFLAFFLYKSASSTFCRKLSLAAFVYIHLWFSFIHPRRKTLMFRVLFCWKHWLGVRWSNINFFILEFCVSH